MDGPARVIPRMAATFVATPDARPRRAFPTASSVGSADETNPRDTPRARSGTAPRPPPPPRVSFTSRGPPDPPGPSPVARGRDRVCRAPRCRNVDGAAVFSTHLTVGRAMFHRRPGRNADAAAFISTGVPDGAQGICVCQLVFFTAIVERARATAAVAYHARGAERPRARRERCSPSQTSRRGANRGGLARTRTSGRHVSRVQGSDPAMADGEIRVVAHGGARGRRCAARPGRT